MTKRTNHSESARRERNETSMQKNQTRRFQNEVKHTRKVQDFCQKMLLLLYPDRCPVCNRVLQDTLICPGCAKKSGILHSRFAAPAGSS